MWGASETHRLSSLDLYGIGGKILVPTWGSGNAHIRIAQYLLEETVRSLEIVSRRDGTYEGISQQNMETRLRDLASMTLSMWDASYDFLLRSAGSSFRIAVSNFLLYNSNLESPQNQLEVETFRQQFSAARAQILRSLGKYFPFILRPRFLKSLSFQWNGVVLPLRLIWPTNITSIDFLLSSVHIPPTEGLTRSCITCGNTGKLLRSISINGIWKMVRCNTLDNAF